MTSQASNRNSAMLVSRVELSMPKWVTEQSNRIGPLPPPPPKSPENGQTLSKESSLAPKAKQPEPDYEVIEFSNQQYSNAPIRPGSGSSGFRTPENKLKCTLCGSGNPWVTCGECSQQIFCASCDDMFHKHPKRRNHQRKTIETHSPPLPPKVLPGQSVPTPPVAPPRRNKRGFMTPIMQRKDQGNTMPEPFPKATSLTPSMKNLFWQERLVSNPKGLNLLNRPLPETPKTLSESSRSTTPKSVFDKIQRPPSVALEKIKSKANATLGRMQLLQQRYRQQKEQMKSGAATDQNMSAFDQWSSISQSSSHFRSGSMSSGINSSFLDLMDDNNINLFHQRQMASQQSGQRGMFSSVFNLNQIKRQERDTNNEWTNNSMQQAQSMAQLNCGNCNQHQIKWKGPNQRLMHFSQDPWSNQLSSQHHLNCSNMSLNVPPGYMMQSQMNNMYPSPPFINQRNLLPQMYPQSYMGGMAVMNPGLICMPPSTPRATSRVASRMASPALSRKSVTLRRKQRSSYIDDEATDDEDSDENDARSITSTRSGISRTRQRRLSSAYQSQLDDDIESTHAKLYSSRTRNQRKNSLARSVHSDWAPGRKSSINNNRSADSGFNSPLKHLRIYSDLDSEGSGTRALVQAKIEQKLKEESIKQKQSKSKRQSKSPAPQKTTAAVQTAAVKQPRKQEKKENLTVAPMKQENKIFEKEKNESLKVVDKQGNAREEDDEADNKNGQSDSNFINQNGKALEMTKNLMEDNLGPPPSTPDYEWECEFCTFVNEVNIKICSICCKTPTVEPKKAVKSLPSLKQVMSSVDKESPLNSPQPLSTQRTMAINMEPPKITNNLETSKTRFSHNINDHRESTSETLQNKETVEDIWTTLEENIRTTTNDITLKAQFIEPSKASDSADFSSKTPMFEHPENLLRESYANEVATSPSSQSIFEHTNDNLTKRGKETRDESIAKSEPQSLYKDIIQIRDQKSFEAEVLTNIHNISHISSHYYNDYENPPTCSIPDLQRYHSNNDLRMDGTIPMDSEAFNDLKNQQPHTSEQKLLKKVFTTSSQMCSPFESSTGDLLYRELSSIRPNDKQIHKESDFYKYTTEELNAALKYSGSDVHPLVWLRVNWPKLIQTVQSLATKYGQERSENTIGTISEIEAREALRLHTGNIWQAVSECIEQRQKKFREISLQGNFSREDIVTALTAHQGNVELALLDLGRTQLQPFLMRIWGSPGGVENESGTQPLLTATHSSVQCKNSKDIHSFLSDSAAECMPTSNATSAPLTNNQLPSPFDRPASFRSPIESNNYTLSYSTENKNVASSPSQIGESILCNKNVLKDVETLIGNMEHNQQKQNEQVLKSIQDIISNVSPKVENEYDPESMRILNKSPIISPKFKTTDNDSTSENKFDVKNFVWQHIQEIVPNLVQQVKTELVEDNEDKIKFNERIEKPIKTVPEINKTASISPPPPIDQDEFLMEEVIKPNIKNAFTQVELPTQYVNAAEISLFQFAFEKALQTEHEDDFEYERLEEAPVKVYNMYKAAGDLTLSQKSEFIGQPIDRTAVVDTKVYLNEVSSVTQLNSSTKKISDENFGLHAHQIPENQAGNLHEIVIKLDVMSDTKFEMLTKKSDETQAYNERINSCEKILAEEDIDIVAEKNDTKTTDINRPSLTTQAKLAYNKEENFENAFPPTQSNKHNKDQYNQTTEKDLLIEFKEAKVGSEIKKILSQDKLNSTLSEDSVNPQVFNLSSTLKTESKLVQEINTSSNHNIIETAADSSVQPHEIGTVSEIELKDLKTNIPNKRISKIPIRQTASNKLLIKSGTISSKNYSNGDKKSQKLNSATRKVETEVLQSLSEMIQPISLPISDLDNSRSDQYPSGSSEMFLVINQEGLGNTITIVPSRSTSSLSSISPSSSLKSPTEFKPSGDPLKLNLTELVEDTQRLIKQMKDEISVDDFESSTDECDYSEDFSDEYDDEEEEESYWQKGEEEDYHEYEDTADDTTEEEGSISKTQSPSPSQYQESSEHRAIHNSSALSNISSNHSLTLIHDQFDLKDLIITKKNHTGNQNVFVDQSTEFVETENALPELPVEEVICNNLESSQSSMQQYAEDGNTRLVMSIENVFPYAVTQDDKILTNNNHYNIQSDSKVDQVLTSDPKYILSDPTFTPNEVKSENGVPEMAQVRDSREYVTESLNENQQPSPTNNLIFKEKLGTNVLPNNMSPHEMSEHLSTISIQEKTSFAIQHTPTETQTKQSQSEEEFISGNSDTNLAITLHNTLDDKSSEQNRTSAENESNITSTNQLLKSTQNKEKTNEDRNNSAKQSNTSSKIPKPKETTKETKQKETVALKRKSDLKKNIYTRSKSFSGPSTPIGIASVKTISQKFISSSPNTQLMTPKKYISSTSKSSIVETINKFTKSSTVPEKPDAHFPFKYKAQPRIPKKKYHETCFSDDDYEPSPSEEEIEPLDVRQRKLSIPVFKVYPSVQELEEIDSQELIENFMKENLTTTVAEAQLAATLISMKFPQDVSLWAAKECSDLDHAIALLKQECELCSGTYALNQIVSMLKCTHKCCKGCAKNYFTVQVTERSINDCNCPFCKLPALDNQTEHEDENLEYFSNLDIFLKNILEPEVHELFQRKLRDRTLLKDPNFKWCMHCSSGFFSRPKQKRLICPDCGSVTCAQCRKTWQKQHEGISCDQFSEWESANDPEVQAQGVQQHLEQNGIDCPKCKFKYSLARGGCMHFTCTQCKYEFCYGCAKPFMMGAKCTISPYCAKLGLHAHHPRNCLFYLRDKLPVQLQILLKNHNVPFEVDRLGFSDSGDDNEASSSKKKESFCPIPIQKETPTGLVDTRCNGDVPEKHAGMCRNHYVEYLTAKVAKAKIDPLPIFDLTDCVQELRRRGIPLPERGPWDTDEIYKNMCAEVIEKNIPLDTN